MFIYQWVDVHNNSTTYTCFSKGAATANELIKKEIHWQGESENQTSLKEKKPMNFHTMLVTRLSTENSVLFFLTKNFLNIIVKKGASEPFVKMS